MSIRADQALFNRWPAGDQCDGDAPYRATVFWNPEHNPNKMVPFVRCRLGGIEQESRSALAFAPGEGAVGLSWKLLAEADHVGGYVVKRGKSLADCGGNLKQWREQWIQSGLTEENANDLGRREGDYIRNVRSIACIGVETTYGPLVFCVDSTRERAFEDQQLTDAPADQSLETCLMTLLRATVVGHVDFWTWLKQMHPGRATMVTTGVAAIASVGLELAKYLLGDARTTVLSLGHIVVKHGVSVALTLAWLVPLMMVFFGLLPSYEETAERDSQPDTLRPRRERLSLFTRRWARAVWLGILSLVVLTVSTWFEMDARMLDLCKLLKVVATTLQAAAAYCFLATFYAIARFSRDASGQAATAVPERVNALILLTAIAAFVLVLLDNVGVPYALSAGHCLISALTSIALCLIVGRLDSELIGVPGTVMSLLYLDAVAHAVCAFADPQTLAVVLLVRLPLDVLLMAVVTWAIEGRALERYLTYAAEVAGLAPQSPQVHRRRTGSLLRRRGER